MPATHMSAGLVVADVTPHDPMYLDALPPVGPAGRKERWGAIADSLLVPRGTNPVTVSVDGTPVETWDILASACEGVMGADGVMGYDPDADAAARAMLCAGFRHWDPDMHFDVDEAVINCWDNALGPLGDIGVPYIVWGVDDVIGPAKDHLVACAGHDAGAAVRAAHTMAVGLDALYRPRTLGVWFTDARAFARFVERLKSDAAAWGAALPASTARLVASFAAEVTLDSLTESLILRTDGQPGDDDLSFARLLSSTIMACAADEAKSGRSDMGLMPFSLAQAARPTSVVFVNVERHAGATTAEINAEWRSIGAALLDPPTVMSLDKISRLDEAQRRTAGVIERAAANKRLDADGKPARAAKVAMRREAPAHGDIARDIRRAIGRMARVSRSRNCVTTTGTSYRKANRRHPDDPNYAGRVRRTDYLPDIHVYVDTSGSIRESQYRDTVMTLIGITRAMHVDLFFSSFADTLSATALVPTRDRNPLDVWRAIQAIPKVTGGTNVAQIWNWVAASPRRRREFSLVITDFEFWIPSGRREVPENIYYAPTCDASTWSMTRDAARVFARDMRHLTPCIERHMLGMYE